MIKVFVSGCFDILHGGHIRFLTEAKALGDYLVVSIAGEESLKRHKNKKSSLPIDHKVSILNNLQMIDKVMVSNDDVEGLDFKSNFLEEKPNILVVTEDDKYSAWKKELCQQIGAQYEVLPKSLEYQKISTTDIINRIKAPSEVPLRVDFGGIWLDVPRLKREFGYIVNCTITPMVSLTDWNYPVSCGLGGSAAFSLLNGKNAIQTEMRNNVGWQDPAVIMETGLCIWKSGDLPYLVLKTSPSFLQGKMALLYNDYSHSTRDIVDNYRDYDLIERAGIMAAKGVYEGCLLHLGYSMTLQYTAQLKEGMSILPSGYNEVGKCYQGSGYSMALYLFTDESDRDKFLKQKNTFKIEPYMRGLQ
jgi:cytidyltransferase-like protein